MKKKLTNNREKVLGFIKKTSVPVSAKDINNYFNKKMDLVTVYRSLQYLEKNGYINGFTLSCSKEGTNRFYYKAADPHVHFFHCNICHKFLQLDDCCINIDEKIEKKYNIKINTHTLYYTGVCRDCLT